MDKTQTSPITDGPVELWMLLWDGDEPIAAGRLSSWIDWRLKDGRLRLAYQSVEMQAIGNGRVERGQIVAVVGNIRGFDPGHDPYQHAFHVSVTPDVKLRPGDHLKVVGGEIGITEADA